MLAEDASLDAAKKGRERGSGKRRSFCRGDTVCLEKMIWAGGRWQEKKTQDGVIR